MRLFRSAIPFIPILLSALIGQDAGAQPLVAHAGADISMCAGGPTTLGASPSATGGSGPYQYSWSPATQLSNANVQHPVCTSTTTRTYTLMVIDASGDTAVDAVTVSVLPLPVINLSCTNATASIYGGVLTFSVCGLGANAYDLAFTDASTALPGATFHIIWGNGQTANYSSGGWADTQHYPFGLTSGSYTVQEPGPNGCSRTVPFNVFVGEVPLGGLSVVSNSSICTGDTISFEWNNFQTNPPGTLYIVDYGDGVVDTLPQPPQAAFSHVYTASSCAAGGEFSIAWRITNPCDTRTGQIGQIRVSGSPEVAFTVSPGDTVCSNSTVTFTDNSLGAQAPSCSAPKHIWTISPASGWTASGALGNVNSQPTNPALWISGATALGITFTTPGTYAVMDVTGNICGMDTLIRTICVESPPEPGFMLSPTTGCTPLVSATDNTSVDPNSCSTRYNWLATSVSAPCGGGTSAAFSGGTGAASFEPQFTFTGAGTYSVTLQAINSCGTFPVTVPVVVGAPPQVSVHTVSGICVGQSVLPTATFTPCGSPISTFGWTMPGGSPSSANTENPGSVTYPSGSFTITASATSACGTTTSNASFNVTALPSAPVVGGPITLCVGETLELSAAPVPGITFHWTGPNGFSSYSSSPSIPNITMGGQGTYSVTASGGGCDGPSSTVSVTVDPPLVLSISPAMPTTCAGHAVTLTASGGSNYQWTANGIPVGSGSPLTFMPTGTSTILLTGEGAGCTGSASTQVTVHPLPVANAGTDPVFCESNFPQVLFPITAGGVWSGDPNVSADGHFTPSVQGGHQLIYTVTSPQGCTNTDTVEATVTPPATPAGAGPDSLICLNAAPIQLTGTPAGGSWTGAISIGGIFPPVQTGIFEVHYTVGAGSCATTDSALVTVVPATTLYPGSDQAVCIDEPAFALGATPVGGTWTGAGITGSDFDPQVAGTTAHVLTYTYVDPNGCTTAADRTITVNPLPVVSAGNDTTFCDQPVMQTLAGASPQGGTWSGTGIVPDGTFTPSGPDTLVFTYSFTDANNCLASDQMSVTVIPITDPASAGNDTSLCFNSDTLQLVGLPSGGAWSGSHVDATGSFDPSVVGTFTLTYSVGIGSCATQDQVDVTVHPLPVIAITNPGTFCADADPENFAATPLGGMWSGTGVTDPVGGTFDPAVSGVGEFQVNYAFTDTNGCSNNASANATVDPLPTAQFSTALIACSGTPFLFTDESIGAIGWTWSFGDGDSAFVQTPSHVFDNAGTYTATLVAYTVAGCTDTISHDVTVWAGPAIGFTATPLEGCAPLVVTLDNQSSGEGMSYAWDLGDGGSSTLEEPGQNIYYASLFADTTYTVTLTATNTCGSMDSSIVITVHPAPTALFGPEFDSGCSPWPVTFSNVTIGQADSYSWDFGDGLVSTTSDSLVQHTYFTGANDTTYTITLVAANACGSDTADYTITVLPNSITAFFNTDTTSGCAPLTVNFTQYSIGATNWHWDLGNGEVSTDQNVTTTYDTAGIYTATLFADNGCSFDTVSVDITVLASPPADFDIQGGLLCVGTPIQFTNNTPAPAGLIWEFGDGESSTLAAPTHSYATAGNFTVTLSVASTISPCPATLSQTVNVRTTPSAAFTPEPVSGCIPLNVQFTNGSTASDFYQWSFGDGNTIGTSDPLHTYTTAGTFSIQLVAENLNGCTDTATTYVVAFPLPVSAFTMANSQSCDPTTNLQLNNASTGEVSHGWDLGNGTSSVLNNPVATYTEPGTYTITLTVSNQYGCTDVSTDEFVVYPTPVAQFVPESQQACAGYPVNFGNTSLNTTNYQWRFGDGESSSEGFPWHIYPQGEYDVTLIATGAGGCMDTLSVPAAVHVDPRPTAAFSYVPMQSTTYALQFHNSSVGAMNWFWDFGDGEHSNEFEPLHLFPAGPDDLYPLCLVAINTFGCPDTLCQPVVATSDPDIYAPNAFTPDQDGVNETFLPILNGFDNWRYQFFVFDRWGERIYDTRDRNAPWDGTYHGKSVKTDVYVWKVVLNRNGDERVFHGHVTVVRGTE